MILNGKNVGGAELQFLELAKHLAQTHSVSVISVHGDRAVKHFLLNGSIRLFLFPYNSKGVSLWQLLKAIRRGIVEKPDAIISTSFIGNALAFAISQFFSHVRIVSLQTVSKAMAYPMLDRIILRRFDVLIAGCTDIRDYLISHGQSSDKIEIVNNWVDFSSRVPTQSVAEVRQRLGIPGGVSVIGCVGRMHYQKGQEFLIRAFKDLAEERSDIRLLLVGDGPRMEEMRAEADGHPYIIFTGIADGNDYNNFLNSIDIYVQPSRFEGLPRTLLDAMYMKKAIIATDVNGNRDAIEDKRNGLLVIPESVTEIRDAIFSLLNKKTIRGRLSAQAGEDAVAKYSASKQMGLIESFVSYNDASLL